MHPRFEQLVTDAGLSRILPHLRAAALPAVGFSLERSMTPQPGGSSTFGGRPDLPAQFIWPSNKERPLDFLLQINLAESMEFDLQGLLPSSGMLTFFYDLQNQPSTRP